MDSYVVMLMPHQIEAKNLKAAEVLMDHYMPPDFCFDMIRVRKGIYEMDADPMWIRAESEDDALRLVRMLLPDCFEVRILTIPDALAEPDWAVQSLAEWLPAWNELRVEP